METLSAWSWSTSGLLFDLYSPGQDKEHTVMEITAKEVPEYSLFTGGQCIKFIQIVNLYQ